MLLNPSIQLETFLPPTAGDQYSSVHLIITKDDACLNAGVFFLRVSSWSVEFLMAVATFPYYHPEVELWKDEQSTMMYLLLDENPKYGLGNVAYVPQRWFNAYHEGDAEVQKGDLLVHLPSWDAKFKMGRWLSLAEGRGKHGKRRKDWIISPEKTGLEEEVRLFWQQWVPDETGPWKHKSIEEARREEREKLALKDTMDDVPTVSQAAESKIMPTETIADMQEP